jgi:hypothetical protein
MLRITKFLNRSTTELQIAFSEALDPDIGIDNVRVSSNIVSVPDLVVKSVDITGTVLTAVISPQSPAVTYFIEVVSTTAQAFVGVDNGRLEENGVTNTVFFVGLENENDIRDDLISDAPPVYDTDTNTFVRKYFSIMGDELLKTRVDIQETGNANYICETVTDEVKSRGFGPTDRLDAESVYEITRVSRNPEGTTQAAVTNFNEAQATTLLGADSAKANTGIVGFPTDPLSLKSIRVTETVSNAERLANKFEGLIISLSNSNVTQVNSLTLVRGADTYIYDIPAYNYSLLNTRHDTVHALPLFTLESNQFKLAEAAILDGYFVQPAGSDVLTVNYTYTHNGRDVDTDTVVVSQIRTATRESVGAYLTILSLQNFPIVDSADRILEIGGVSFLDPAPSVGTPFTSTHPAFVQELPFSSSRLPSSAGEYTVDYNTGQVLVYGATTADGTGGSPPVAEYLYRKTYQDTIDYNLDAVVDEIAVVPGRDLAGAEVKLVYFFDDVFAEGTDYLAEVHNEIAEEFVENRLLNTYSIFTENRPITDVSRIINETTGESYVITRFDENKVEFNGRQLPRIQGIENEFANFAQVPAEEVYITEEIEVTATYKIVAAQLQNDNLGSFSGQYTGANVNSSITLSRTDLFLREFFYDNEIQTLAQNLAKLTTIGDYLVDFENGIIYLYAAADQTYDLGDIGYSHASVETIHPNISGVNAINYKKNTKSDPLVTLELDSSTATTIEVKEMPSAVERFLNGDTDKPILLGAVLFGVIGQYTVGSDRFISPDAVFTDSHADGYHTLRIAGDSDRGILSVISATEVVVDVAFTDTRRGISWCLLDGNPIFPAGDGYTTVTTHSIDSIRGVYSIAELQSLDAGSLTNYYDPAVDEISGNTITFRNALIGTLTSGEALAIDYTFGRLYLDYDYVFDNLRVSYEYGDNSLNFSVSDVLDPGEEYFVSYKYGALREPLITNFGALTQLQELVSIPTDFDRELYRDFLKGTLQGFVAGPTKESISNLVESVTRIAPDIREHTFDEWTLSRDNLYLDQGSFFGTPVYDAAKFENGIVISGTDTLSYPSEAYLSYREGSFETWGKPNWAGAANDATLTFAIAQDGYALDSDGYGIADGYGLNLDEIFIGASAWNPTVTPFSINRADPAPSSPVGRPANFGSVPGYFIWYDDINNEWVMAGVAEPNFGVTLSGTITTTGEFYNVEGDGYTADDGYTMETSDTITSTKEYIDYVFNFDALEVADGYDGYVGWDGVTTTPDGYFFSDQFTFSSDNLHYLLDAGPSDSHNRISIFKDGSRYLNFRIFDDSGKRRAGTARQYSISTDISGWNEGDLHMIGASWRLNSAEGIDEMHLFVDGQEVSNLFKFGGRPQTTATDIYRTVASEILTTSATQTVAGGEDGVSVAGSATFTSATSDFITDGITGGDTLHILDATIDGIGSPYTVLSVPTSTSIVLTSNLTLSLSGVSFVVNQTAFTTETNIDTEVFAVYAVDGYGVTRELHGLDATIPDYSISRSAGINTITFLDNVDAGDQVYINTLGLTKGRCRDTIFKYDGYSIADGYTNNIIETRLAPPSDLANFDIYKVPFLKTSIEDNGAPTNVDGYFVASGDDVDGYFTNLCQPSETTNGKAYAATLGGFDHIDFTGTNTVTLHGTTFGGPTSEVLTFTGYGTQTTTNFFTVLTAIDASFDGSDGYVSLGSLEVVESVPLTKIENSGEYAIPVSYDNGVITLHTFGSGGSPYNLESCHYRFDYPIDLNIPMTEKGRLFIGSDINGENQWDGVIDQVVLLNDMLDDIRTGEDKGTQRTMTQDFNSSLPATITPQTLMLANFNDAITNVDRYYTNFDERFLTTSSSVNLNFGDAAVFLNDPYVIDNGSVVFNNNEGTAEFWVSPLIDTLYDASHQRYYLDITSIEIETVTSTTAIIATLTQRARKILSVRLLSDDGSGTNYFDDGVLAVDGKTITLGQALPGQQTQVKVEFVPIDFNGDRVSIYKDGYGSLNFAITADNEFFQIAYPITWRRDTWHRVKATWRTNTVDATDRMRLFIDGVESGSITYGTPGLLYGAGIVYGSAAVGSLEADFLTTDINLTDTFGEVFIGNSFDGSGKSKAKIDNLRFSNVIRAPSIVAGVAVDLNYNANLDAIFPVIEDNSTTGLFDFDMSLDESEFLSNLLSKYTPLFSFEVCIDDAFRRVVDDPQAKELLIKIINRMKPSHASLFVKFLQDN